MRDVVQKIHKYSLYALIFSLPWQTIWIIQEVFFNSEKWQYGTIGIYISDIFLVTFIVSSLIIYRNQIEAFIYQRKDLIILLLLCSFWVFASVFWSSDKSIALYTAIKFSLAIDLFLILCIIPISYTKIATIFIYSMVLQSIIGLWQFITQNTVAQKYLGLQQYEIWHGATATVSTDAERWLRAYGGLPHPNILGGLAVIALIIAISLYIKNTKEDWFAKTTLLFSMIILASSTVLTFSRSAWLAGLIGLGFFTIHSIVQKYFCKKLLFSLLVIIITSLLWVSIFPDVFLSRSSATTQSHNSFSDRSSYITHASQLLHKYPIGGAGVGNFTNTAHKTVDSSEPIWKFQPVHNIYILLLSEIGIVGFVLFSITFLKTLFPMKLNIIKKKTAITTVVVLLSLLIMGVFDHWPLTSHSGIFIFSIILSAIYKKTHSRECVLEKAT